MTRAPWRARRLGAIALGLALAAVPFARYRFAAPHPTAHADHGAHHGGIVGMVGEVHLEVVRGAGVIEIYPTDAYRRPLVARAGRVSFSGGPSAPLAWHDDRLRAPDDPSARAAGCEVLLADGRVVRMDVEF
jgi:hypothetical protein